MECDFSIYLDNEQLLSFHDSFDTILALFEANQIHNLLDKAAERFITQNAITDRDGSDFSDEDCPFIYGSQTVTEIRNKLKVLGYGKNGVKDWYEHQRAAMLDMNHNSITRNSDRNDAHELFAQVAQEAQSENIIIESFTFDEWFDIITSRISASDERLAIAQKLLHYYDDPLFALGVMLTDIDGDKNLIFDFTDLYEYSDEISGSIEAYKNNSGRPIIITEGTTDVEFLENSIAILYPYLSRYIRFLETDFKPETNADAILKMAKNFASAGMSENMLFILDNDTAGTAAIASFGASARRQLPSNFCITQYPEVDLLNNYPTKGPQGDSNLNVNGRSGSIELYLGRDSLTDREGNLFPIQWKGFNEKVNAYQGEVLNKHAIQVAFRSKYRKVLSSKTVDANWVEMTALIEHIIESLSNLPCISPMQSS